jgi:hypothetical protein
VPELRTEEIPDAPPELAPQGPAPAAAPQDETSVAERMLAESEPADPAVANAYAAAAEEEGGLTGFVLKLFKE